MKTLLLVEDNPGELEAYRICAKAEGFEVTGIIFPGQLTKQIREQEFDLALIDGLNGGYNLVYSKIKAKRKVVYSNDCMVLNQARTKGWEAESKTGKSLREILEQSQQEQGETR